MAGAGSSRIGRQRTWQRIKLDKDVSKNTVIHEILHAAGMWHEQSRGDRDRHIKILWENISNGQKHNFDKHSNTGYKITPYDKNSIMHYGGYAFSKSSGLPTIVDARTDVPVRPDSGLSAMDIDGVNTLYERDYAGYVTPPFTSIRFVKTTIQRVKSGSSDGGIKRSGIDFYMRNETGPGWDWRPGNKNNPSEKFKSKTVTESDNDISPNWQFRYSIARNEEYAKVWLKLKDDDGASRNNRSDETVDINPFPGIKEIELYVNTQNGQIYLGNIDGLREDVNYIGQVGEPLDLQGFDRGLKAEITFRIEIE